MVWIIAGVLIAMWVLESVTSHNGRIHTNPPRGPRGRVSRLAQPLPFASEYPTLLPSLWGGVVTDNASYLRQWYESCLLYRLKEIAHENSTVI